MADKGVVFWLLSILSTTVVGSLGTSSDAGVQNELLDRIIALEKQGQHHAEEMQAMKSRFEKQDQKLVNQDRTISDYKVRLEEQDQKLVNQDMVISDYKLRLEEQDQKLANQDRTISDYKVRLEEQDQKLVNQDMVISDYKLRLEEQDQKLANQDRTISDNKQRLDDKDNRLTVQERAIRDYKQKVADLEQTVAELKHQQDQRAEGPVESNAGIIRQNGPAHSNFRKATERQMRALLNAEGPVAFHAVISATVTHLGLNQKLVFPVVQANLGGGYHNQHGLFIAPQPGVYIFSTSIMSDTGGHDAIGVNIMKNGHVLARAWGHGEAGYQDQGSVTVVTQLAAADEVWVSLLGPADTSLYGGSYDSFMGCLVVPL